MTKQMFLQSALICRFVTTNITLKGMFPMMFNFKVILNKLIEFNDLSFKSFKFYHNIIQCLANFTTNSTFLNIILLASVDIHPPQDVLHVLDVVF